ncbi:hypothetical protein ACLMJK_003388 [Lecanora helva]
MDRVKEAPQQYSQPSRKGKKAWRKNVNVSDVQTGLEEAREELIKGGIIAERASDSLFVLDTSGSSNIQKTYNQTHKPLKADAILAQRSAIPAIDSHKRPIGVTDGVIEPSSKKRKTNGVSPKEYERLKAVAYGSKSVEDVIKTTDAPEYDPWALKQPEEEAQDPKFSYLEKEKPIRAPPTLREAPVSLAAAKGEVPAVPAPKPGTSYNPTFEDWDALIIAEGEKEVEAEKKRLHEAELEKARLDRIAAAEEEREYSDIQAEDESAWEGFESDFSNAEWLKKKRPERKTPAERNKVKRRKEAERKDKWERKQKEKEKQQKQIHEIVREAKQEVKAKEQALAKFREHATRENVEADERVLRRRKFGKDALPEPPLELVLPDELQDSLRLLKPEGNLLKDRFRNILVRGKMETRKPIQQPKKKRRQITEKWSYKDFAVPS